MVYTIGEISNILNIPASTLRFYDKKGILPIMERSSGGIRMFKDSDLEFLKIIECLKKSGLSLSEIKDFIDMADQGDKTLDERYQLFENRKKEVERQMQELQETLDIVNYKCWFYKTAKELGSSEKVQQLKPNEIPVEFQETLKKLKSTNS